MRRLAPRRSFFAGRYQAALAKRATEGTLRSTTVRTEPLIDFASNDYLGIAHNTSFAAAHFAAEARRADAASLARSLASRARERKEAERRFEVEHDAAEAASAANAARAADRQRHGLALARERDAALRQLAVVRAELDAAKSQAKRGLFSSEDDPVLPMAAGGSLRIR